MANLPLGKLPAPTCFSMPPKVWGVKEIADTLRVGRSTIHRTRPRFVEEGLEPALSKRRRASGRHKLEGKQEAFLVALACSTPPAGRAR